MTGYQYEFGFIGMGNMGFAILNGLLKTYDPSQITFLEKNEERSAFVSEETKVCSAVSMEACCNSSKYIILAIKPQQFVPVLEALKKQIQKDQIVISIAPGQSIETLTESLGGMNRIVRAMPNTPALIGEGMTGVTYDATLFSSEEQEVIHHFFESFGKMVVVEEKLMDAVVCASGSAPAYVYMFIEALADSVVKYGMPRVDAYAFVSQMMVGSAKMVLETGEHPGKLKDQVCSPGGTTIAGVAALEEFGFRNAVMKATDACYHKCTNLK